MAAAPAPTSIVDRGRVAADQAAADIGEGGDGEVAALVAREEGAERGLLVEAGEAGGAVAAGEGEVEPRRRRRPPPPAPRGTEAAPRAAAYGRGRGGRDASDGEIASNILVIELVGPAGEDDLAAIHDRETVGEPAGEVEILLDQEDGHLALASATARARGRCP